MGDILTPEITERLLKTAFEPIEPPPEFRVTIKMLIADTWREAQLAKCQKEVCPELREYLVKTFCGECSSEGCMMRFSPFKPLCHKLEGIVNVTTCKGTGLKARPDREKIAKLLCDKENPVMSVNEVSYWDEKASDPYKEIFLTVADQIIELTEG